MKTTLLFVALLATAQPVLAQRNPNAPADLRELEARLANMEQQVAGLQQALAGLTPDAQVAGSRYLVSVFMSHMFALNEAPVQSILIGSATNELSFYEDGTGEQVQLRCTTTRLLDPDYNIDGGPAIGDITSQGELCQPQGFQFEYVQVDNTVLLSYANGVTAEITVSDDGGQITYGISRANFGVSPGAGAANTHDSGFAMIWSGVRLSEAAE